MSGLSRRLRCLEASGVRGGCPECGLAPGEPFDGYEVVWHDEEDADPKPGWCGTCGRQTTYVVGWGDLAHEDPGEGLT